MREIRLSVTPSEIDSLDRVVSSAIAAYNNAPVPRRKRDRRSLIEARDLVIELRLAIRRNDASMSSP
jgi:hypothetical protein